MTKERPMFARRAVPFAAGRRLTIDGPWRRSTADRSAAVEVGSCPEAFAETSLRRRIDGRSSDSRREVPDADRGG